MQQSNESESISAEPNFNNTSIVDTVVAINDLWCHVELGTYVSFIQEDDLKYGCIINKCSSGDVVINKYYMSSEVSAEIPPSTLPSPIQKRFIGVSKIFRTFIFL